MIKVGLGEVNYECHNRSKGGCQGHLCSLYVSFHLMLYPQAHVHVHVQCVLRVPVHNGHVSSTHECG